MSNTMGYRCIGGPLDGTRLRLPKGTVEYTHHAKGGVGQEMSHTYRVRELAVKDGSDSEIKVLAPANWTPRNIIGHMLRCHSARPTEWDTVSPGTPLTGFTGDAGPFKFDHGKTEQPRAPRGPLGGLDLMSLLAGSLGGKAHRVGPDEVVFEGTLDDLMSSLGGLDGSQPRRRRPPADPIAELARSLGARLRPEAAGLHSSTLEQVMAQEGLEPIGQDHPLYSVATKMAASMGGKAVLKGDAVGVLIER